MGKMLTLIQNSGLLVLYIVLVGFRHGKQSISCSLANMFDINSSAYGQTYGLKTLINPKGCIASEICSTQPSVAAVYRTNREIAYSFTGSIYVQFASGPTEYEKLYIRETCGNKECDLEVVGSYASITIFNGVSSFEVGICRNLCKLNFIFDIWFRIWCSRKLAHTP